MSDTAPSPFTFEVDEARRVIRVTARETLSGNALIAIIDRQLAEGYWSFGMLYDLRRIDRMTSSGDTRIVAEYVQQAVREHGERGPVAIVTRQAGVLSGGQIYAYHTKSAVRVEVFWDMDEAHAWLDKSVAPER
jgi:hypothetical protein